MTDEISDQSPAIRAADRVSRELEDNMLCVYPMDPETTFGRLGYQYRCILPFNTEKKEYALKLLDHIANAIASEEGCHFERTESEVEPTLRVSLVLLRFQWVCTCKTPSM